MKRLRVDYYIDSMGKKGVHRSKREKKSPSLPSPALKQEKKTDQKGCLNLEVPLLMVEENS